MDDFKVRYGPWALITGASSGLGEEFARELAALGLNLVLVARRSEALEMLAEELKKRHDILVRCVPVDLSEPNSIQVIEETTHDIEVGFLVPNAGMEIHGDFIDEKTSDELKMIQINIISPMQLAHNYGHKMVERGRGGILFVAASLGHGPAPYLANFAASKAYILTLGESLHYELKQKGVDVTVLSPGWTRTHMTEEMEHSGVDFSKLPLKPMDVTAAVHSGLNSIGKKSSVIPGLMNKTFAFMERHILSRNAGVNVTGHILEKAFHKKD